MPVHTFGLSEMACFNCGELCLYDTSGFCEPCEDYINQMDASAPKEVPDCKTLTSV